VSRDKLADFLQSKSVFGNELLLGQWDAERCAMYEAERNTVYYMWIAILLGLIVFWAFATGGIWSLITLIS
jgi:hypothetical protein